MWYQAYASTSELYDTIKLPGPYYLWALSSINTEHSAKGLKHDILSLKRNCLSYDQALVLYTLSMFGEPMAFGKGANTDCGEGGRVSAWVCIDLNLFSVYIYT